MAPLPQLEDIETYSSCEWDLKRDPDARRYWVQLFCEHLDLLAEMIRREYPDTPPGKLAQFQTDYRAAMRALDAEPERFEQIDILFMDHVRREVQHRYGFADPYRDIKTRENDLACRLLPELLRELEGLPADARVDQLARGLMAGNIFDLGAMAAVERYRSQDTDFRRLRAEQPPRPWLIDDLDAWRERWSDGAAYRHVAFFVDNAGADICLGCLPLARWMLGKGSRVTLAANSDPALNDVTAPELTSLLTQIADTDSYLAQAIAGGRLAVVASGGWAPLIDLTQLADACVAAITDADLLILLGMGRAIESNFRARFSCDSLRSAVVKDPAVARWIGGRMFDCVFRFEQAN